MSKSIKLDFYEPSKKTFTSSEGNVYPFSSSEYEMPIIVAKVVSFKEGRTSLQELYTWLLEWKYDDI